jgi:hypothetical protein
VVEQANSPVLRTRSARFKKIFWPLSQEAMLVQKANQSLHRSGSTLVTARVRRSGDFAPAARCKRCSRPGELNR